MSGIERNSVGLRLGEMLPGSTDNGGRGVPVCDLTRSEFEKAWEPILERYIREAEPQVYRGSPSSVVLEYARHVFDLDEMWSRYVAGLGG